MNPFSWIIVPFICPILNTLFGTCQLYEVFFILNFIGSIIGILLIIIGYLNSREYVLKSKYKQEEEKFDQYLEIFNRTYNKDWNNTKQKAREFRKWLKDNDYDLS